MGLLEGGLGIRSMHEIAPIAYVSSWALVIPYLEKVMGETCDLSGLYLDTDIHHITEDSDREEHASQPFRPNHVRTEILQALQQINEKKSWASQTWTWRQS